MRKWLTALLAVVALSAGIAWGEVQNEKTKACSKDSASCCCCAQSCTK